jgi:hypothetical protein
VAFTALSTPYGLSYVPHDRRQTPESDGGHPDDAAEGGADEGKPLVLIV